MAALNNIVADPVYQPIDVGRESEAHPAFEN